MLAVTVGVQSSTLYRAFVSGVSFFFSPSCITFYGLTFIADDSRYMATLLIFKPVLKVMWSTHVWLLP